MRSLQSHPVTVDEIEQCLNRLADEFRQEGRRGDMRPVLLQRAAVIVRRAGLMEGPAEVSAPKEE